MSGIKDTADAIKGIVEAVPVYDDLLQPAVQELGKGMHTLSKTINIALSPVSALVWGYDQIKSYLQSSIENKLKDVPTENIIPPDPTVAVPAIEALRYTGHKDDLREMFSNLIATAMDNRTAPKAHPSFVQIIKQINSDEAKILTLLTDDPMPIISAHAVNKENSLFTEVLKDFSFLPYISKCDFPELAPSYLQNISRLGLAEINYSTYVIKTGDDSEPLTDYDYDYIDLQNHPIVKDLEVNVTSLETSFEIQQGTFTRNNYGKIFYETCILNK